MTRQQGAVNVAICEALGFDPHQVKRIELVISYDALQLLTVTMLQTEEKSSLLTEEQSTRLIAKVKAFTFTKRSVRLPH